jgi:hypothetical protein
MKTTIGSHTKPTRNSIYHLIDIVVYDDGKYVETVDSFTGYTLVECKEKLSKERPDIVVDKFVSAKSLRT